MKGAAQADIGSPSEAVREKLCELARACRILEMEGHGDMTLGHVAMRAEGQSGFWMKRNRAGLGEILGPEDFVFVDWEGRQLAGSGGRHAEWPIHSEILAARPDVNYVAHTHPFYACVISGAIEPIAPFTLDADYFADIPRHRDDVALITLKEEGRALAKSLADHFAVFMGNHGVTFCGATLQQMLCVGLFLEKACKAHLVGRSSGLAVQMPSAETRQRRRQQIMTPVHWEHSWSYFCRKLAAREGATAAPLFS